MAKLPRSLTWVAVTVLAVVGLSAVATFGVLDVLNRPLHRAETPLYIEVKPGDGLQRVVAEWERRGWVSSNAVLLLRIYGRVTGLAGQLKAGEYAVAEGRSARQLLAQIAAGEVVQHRLTVVEGWTFEQLLAALRKHDRIEFTLEGVATDEIMAALGLEAELHPEGLFYPTTYHFPSGTTDRELLRRAYRLMQERLGAIWSERQADLVLETPYQALILASIIERETGADNERNRIAGVFERRLKKGMRLQTDPTVIYGLGEELEGRLRRADLRRDTPYNTYTRRGLPPTPIALPGSASIAAAVNPAPGDELYFVSRGDGSHHFSATLDEHNQAVRRYILGQE